MGCGQSRVGPRSRLQCQFDGMVRMCRQGSFKDTKLSTKTLLKDQDGDSEDSKRSAPSEANPMPERVKVKVTVAPHLQDGDEDVDKDVQEKREVNVTFIKYEALVKDEEEDEKKRDHRWMGRGGSPSFKIYLPKSTTSDEEDVTDVDEAKSINEDPSSTNEVCTCDEGKDDQKKGRGTNKVGKKRRLSITSCCKQQPPPQQRED